MTTAPIYEPIAYISDDYFQWPKKGGLLGDRNDKDSQGAIQTRRLTQNTTNNNADSNLPEANESEAGQWPIP